MPSQRLPVIQFGEQFLAPLPERLLLGFSHAVEIFVNHAHALIAAKQVAVTHQEMPVK